MSTKEPKLWVGQFEDGEVVVFDPQAQKRSEPDWVYLWSCETQQTDRYAKDILKKAIRSMTVADEAKSVIDRYLSIRDAQRKLVQDKAVFNHREFMARLGFTYIGTRSATARSPHFVRTPWCWNCKSDLDNRIQLECQKCGWILCECGACGCGRNA